MYESDENISKEEFVKIESINRSKSNINGHKYCMGCNMDL
jgi:hypothetical protein